MKIDENTTVAVLLVAAGRGSRAATASDTSPKQYRTIGGVSVIARSIKVFQDHPRVGPVVAVIHRDDGAAFTEATGEAGRDVATVPGGATRQASVLCGLEHLASLPAPPDIVLIHDAVRPFVAPSVIDDVILALGDSEGAIAALPAIETLKTETENGHIAKTVPRAGVWSAQTPQGFHFAPILAAHRAAAESERSDFTDDAAVAEWYGAAVRLVAGNRDNVKLTTAGDLASADRRLKMEALMHMADIRVGSGFDVHAFVEGSEVILGGVAIPHDKRLSGHSDADVAMHAVTDALFGALGDGDIGSHFPPSEPEWKGAASRIFLEKAVSLVQERGGGIAHIDVTIICEAPKIGPHRDAIRESLAALCGLAVERVSVKATTTEKLGFTGRKEGIAAQATATIRLPFDDGAADG
ncbi:bifunctional 2-C-methyl-D-erythritol 4-phosphate cytidylyltransferase/2-C-methyl-D-erythritol 2,4-cyclodiphosphate synthase [Rhodobium gokarnense]|uniref:Bifunctional enzyme IspD/IspF n=1 Tax=Rhodobium gokarnense TaxID=364296 RepID=A0ABT3HB13_9HYPH|nr:bifunctional 2-C-methyl-D-erythritol 4-phosphate cytidylyltransferase/2-C-methyl-D-erythritol 2,4-cyclodiphosphate synthase [Rhodobium gokarnense]MCW2307588.1 2-C-methyl-D-erythritol 4-phosphate cytidylyltransferase/2-C-methyl-D-erythritol 2,4-cyclodiphosphate synthase [Rhodobium gokarnense]